MSNQGSQEVVSTAHYLNRDRRHANDAVPVAYRIQLATLA